MNKLVLYSDSSEDEKEGDDTLKKEVKRKLPMPFKADDDYDDAAKKVKTNESDQHQGRTRTIPHQEGNWPSHIFIDCKYENNT
jgi:hypothetical protein